MGEQHKAQGFGSPSLKHREFSLAGFWNSDLEGVLTSAATGLHRRLGARVGAFLFESCKIHVDLLATLGATLSQVDGFLGFTTGRKNTDESETPNFSIIFDLW